MNSRTIVVGVLCLSLVFVSLGCTQRLTDFTVISSKNVDLSRAAEFKRGSARVEGRDTTYIIIFFPTGIPNLKEAIDRAIEDVPGAVALVDGVVTFEHWYIPLIFGQQSYVVEGLPLIDRSLLSGQELPSNYIVSYYDESNNEQKVIYLTETEFSDVKTAIKNKDTKALKNILITN
ncbi:MAG: hypothetical protein ABIF87_07855 [Pseudomonadota bacterium]